MPEDPTFVAKGFRHGTHRLIPPAETVEGIRRLMPAMGITRIANVTGLDRIGIPVVMVCRPNSRSLAVSQGKGLDLAAARASGLMESVEHYHAERITLPLKLASFNELRFNHRLVDVDRLPRVSINAFHRDLRMLWIEGFDLFDGAPVWLPHECVHLNTTLPLPPGSGSFQFGSNGLASGNHLLEATSHALCEVIERDATALWEAKGPAARRETRLDPATVDDPPCREVLARYERAGIEVALWETTSDLGVAVFQCEIFDRERAGARPLFPAGGVGCHPAREVALMRALTEAAQSRLTLISGARDDMARSDYARFGNPDVVAELIEERRHEGAMRSFSNAPRRELPTFDEELSWLLERLHKAGFDHAVAVDLTQPGLEVPVVRVVIPGLEGSPEAPGYEPGLRSLDSARRHPA